MAKHWQTVGLLGSDRRLRAGSVIIVASFFETSSGGSTQQGDQANSNHWTVTLQAVGHDAKDELGIQ